MGTEVKIGTVARNYPKPSEAKGDMVEIYLGRNVRGAQLEGQGTPILPVDINAYSYELRMGEKNVVPRDVYQQILNSQSRTLVPDMEKAEKSPRPFGQPGHVIEQSLCDYEVALIKEGV